MKTTLVFVGTLSLAASAFAFSRSFTLKSATANLSEPSAYSAVSGGTLGVDVPSLRTDEIVIPDGMTFILSNATDKVSSANWTVANQIGRFRPTAAKSYLRVVVNGETPAKLTCGFNGRGVKDTGCFFKEGSGELILDPVQPSACGATYELLGSYYCGSMQIKDGTLAPACRIQEWELTVAKTATLVLADDSSHYSVNTYYFSGSGMVTNREPNSKYLHYLQINQNAEKNKFTGVIGGRVTLEMYNGYLALSATNSTRTSSIALTGAKGTAVLEVPTFGGIRSASTRASIFGVGADSIYFYLQAGRMLYTGTGEETNLGFSHYAYQSPAIIDAGPTGGLKLKRANDSGIFTGGHSSKRPAGDVKYLILQGDGPKENVVSANYLWDEKACANGYSLPFYVEKRGAGTWRLDTPSIGSYLRTGPTQVSGGTLRVADWAEKGRVSALGLGTRLLGPYFTGDPSTATPLDYSVLVGGATTNCTLEFYGTQDVANWSRPIALTNSYARFRNAGTAIFNNGSLATRNPTGTTLCLDGSNAGTNRFANITKTTGCGPLSVVKEGSATYALTGETTFDGDLTVKAGTLVIDPPENENFRYFRLTIREIANNTASLASEVSVVASTNNESRWIHFDSWALYDANGVRQNVFTSTSKKDTDVPRFEKSVCLIEPGEIAFGRTDARQTTDDWSLRNSIHGLVSSDGGIDGYGSFVRYPGGPVSRTNEASWVTYVCRLTNGTPEIVRYDLGAYFAKNQSNGNYRRSPSSFFIEGSHDGLKWTLLDDVDEIEPPDGFYWYSAPTESILNGGRTAVRPGKGFAFDVAAKTSAAPVPLANVQRVEVAPGATLVALSKSPSINHLAVDVGGGGSGRIEGFALAEDGTIDLVNVPAHGGWSVSGTFANMTTPENLSAWTVKENGEATDRCVLHVSATGFTLTRRNGTILILR